MAVASAAAGLDAEPSGRGSRAAGLDDDTPAAARPTHLRMPQTMRDVIKQYHYVMKCVPLRYHGIAGWRAEVPEWWWWRWRRWWSWWWW